MNTILRDDAEPAASLALDPRSGPSFSLELPDGQVFGGYSRKQAMEYISWMPPGTKIAPPIPPGNLMALDLLDHLCK
jgi:hypothetical protein